MSKPEDELDFQLKAAQIGTWDREQMLVPGRRWRFDFCSRETKIVVEVQGGLFLQGRHNRGAEMEKEYEKFGEAMKLGWLIYQVSPRMIKQGAALQTIEILYNLRTTEHA